MQNDNKFLKLAIDIALNGINEGFGPFGAVIAADGEIIASSANKVVQSHDPTAHAEILAIREAALALGTHNLENCTLYSSCEPCPMCLGAIYWAGIRKVVYASDRQDASRAGFNDGNIYREITLEPGNRKIDFVQIDDPFADNVFRTWEKYENKIRY